jgi:hypothetical protein
MRVAFQVRTASNKPNGPQLVPPGPFVPFISCARVELFATEAHMNFSASPAHNRFAGSLLAAPPTSCMQVQRGSCAFLERVRADGGNGGEASTTLADFLP